jgi:hypothetical protein
MPRTIEDCVVFAGQSNGETAFTPANQPFPGGWTADPNILIWTGAPTANTWAQYDPGTNSNPTWGSTYWGPEAEFARQWRLDSPQKLRIIKRCTGNAGMTYNPVTPGKVWSAYTAGQEFSNLYDDIVAAASALSASNILLNIRAFIFVGCESDTRDATAASRVQRELEMWFDGMRDAVSRPNARGVVAMCKNALPNVPANTPTVRRAQRYVGLLPRNCYTDEDPLTFEGTADGSHLVPSSVVALGAGLYQAYKAATTRLIP